MDNQQPLNNRLGKPSFDCPKSSAWKIDKKDAPSLSGSFMSIDMETESIFESRVYGVPGNMDIKFISKQNLKSGKIDTVILKQDSEGNKTAIGQTAFADENDYARRLKEFELSVPILSKVVTTKEEYNQLIKNQ